MNPSVSAVILAGGQARRMGGQDKGLITIADEPMIAHVLRAIQSQVSAIAINANRHAEAYASFGHPVIADQLADFQGPLAGMAAGLEWCPSDYLLTLPCDGPLLPDDLVMRLQGALSDADVAVAHDGTRLQPVYALIHKRCLPSLQAFLAEGGRKIDRWYACLDQRSADLSDQQTLFVNVNTPEDQAAMTQRFTQPTVNHPL